MKMKDCEIALSYLESIRLLRCRIDTLRELILPENALPKDESVVSGEDFAERYLSAIDEEQAEYRLALACARKELKELVTTVRRAIRRMESPAEGMLIEFMYLYGAGAAALCAGLSLSRSGLQSRLSRSVRSLDKVLKSMGKRALSESEAAS